MKEEINKTKNKISDKSDDEKFDEIDKVLKRKKSEDKDENKDKEENQNKENKKVENNEDIKIKEKDSGNDFYSNIEINVINTGRGNKKERKRSDSFEINAEISYPKMSDSGSINKNCASYILPSDRDKNLYKKYELFLSKNKFHLNNNYDRNNAQIFLKEKNLVMANVDLDDYIEGEEEKTMIDRGDSSYIQNHINANIRKNNVNNQTKNENKINKNNKISHKNINKNDNKKLAQNQSFEGGTGGCPPGSLFDTGKADLLCLLLGMSNK